MKNIVLFLFFAVLLCSGCKFFKKSSAKTVDTLVADTTPAETGIVDSALLYTGLNDNSQAQTAAVGRSNAVNGKYYMIVGCFTVEQNAERYAEKLRGMGYEAQIIAGSDNFQMVSARTYNSYRESVAEIDKFRNELTPNAWVYLQK
jgi:hypothetical protein